MGNFEALAAGLSNSINGYMQAGQKQQRELDTYGKEKSMDVEAQKTMDQNKMDMTGKLTPEMAQQMFGQLSPQFGEAAVNAVTQFKQQNNRDMTMDEANKFMDPIFKMMQAKADKSKSAKEQNTMFEKMKNAVMSSRGDPALSDIAKQQTAIGLGYRTLADSREGKIKLSPAVWADVLGQTWKGRTGGVPTDQVMKDLRQGNTISAMRNTLNELSGYQLNEDVQPKVVIDNMLDFLKQTGDDVDQRYQDLMTTHLVRDPAFENDAKYQELVDAVNKRSFSGYTAQHQSRVQEMRQKESSGAGHAGTEGTTKRGTKFKVLG